MSEIDRAIYAVKLRSGVTTPVRVLVPTQSPFQIRAFNAIARAGGVVFVVLERVDEGRPPKVVTIAMETADYGVFRHTDAPLVVEL